MAGILTVTMNPAIDKSSSVGRVTPEQKLRCRAPQYEPGGGGINVSRAVRLLGGDSTALYLAGGPTGDMLAALLDGEGITHQAVRIRELTRQNLTVYEDSSGQQFRFGMPGPVTTSEECSECLDIISRLNPHPAFIVASGSLPPGVPEDFYGRLAGMARDMGSKMVVDTSGAPLKHAVQEGVFMIKPNARELGQLAGRDIADESEQEKLAQELIRTGRCQVIVVSLGAAGALMVNREGKTRLRSPSVKPRSKVGAGDSMVAGTVIGLERGYSMVEAVRFGVAAGAAAVMTEGTGLCRREDTERLYARMVYGKSGS
jgi:6-phosphofructokinase 2